MLELLRCLEQERRSMNEERSIIVSFIVAILLVIGAYGYLWISDSSSEVEVRPGSLQAPVPVIGEEYSDHAHISFLMIIKNGIADFSSPQFMLRDRKAHFENNDPYTIHKHATGVTLPYFLSTIGFELSQDCLTTPEAETICNDGKNTWRMIVNGEEVERFDTYELMQHDKVLLNYDDDTPTELLIKYNYVQEVPVEVDEGSEHAHDE